MTECKNCQNGGVPIGEHFVSHEMAIDGCCPEIEGASMGIEWGVCPCCMGQWQDCPNCADGVACKMTEHSPLPWTYEDAELNYPWCNIYDQNGNLVAETDNPCSAVRIIDLANTHQQLVEAVEYTLALLRTGLAPDGMFAKEEDWLRHKCNKAAGELAAALAAAKGEQK